MLLGLVLLASCATTQEKKPLTSHEKAVLFLQSGNAALSEGDIVGALQALQTAEDFDPTIPEIYLTRAVALSNKGDLVLSVESAKRALELDPKNSAANNTLGGLLLDQGRYKEAEPYLLKAENDILFREAFKAATNLGNLHYSLGNNKEARLHYDRAIRERPDVACQAYYGRGNLSVKEGNLKLAIQDFDRSIKKSCAKFGEGHLALGMAYARNKEYDRAKRKFLEIKQVFADTRFADRAMEQLRYLP